ncbi:gp53-like domain-containing protein [Tundrisphaera sp. TA3]|uniref:gp53-like domain-containing protein n=1 Tax=Tundrisphaera sp. TA3 TaxID=3435775 RepID=UPI003EBF787E
MVDRRIIYPGSIPLDTDQLQQSQDTMVALGYLAQAILGVSTFVDGLACIPTTPASLGVLVTTGSIYALQNLESSSYGSLAADTTHQIVKQGIIKGDTAFSCPAPATSGQSVVYLVQAQYQNIDGGSTVLPYYNAANPSVPYSGPANSGTAQNTVRRGVCVLNLKVGVAATTGTQATPTPDAGYTALYAITVANGQSTVTSGNIVRVAGAPFLDNKLAVLAPLASPAFTGTPTAPTPALGDLSTLIATTAFVKNLSASSLTSPGYQKFPNGLIMQFGTAFSVAAGNHVDVTYAVAFPTAFLGGFTTALIDSDSTSGSFSTGFSNTLLNPKTQASIRNLSPSGSFNISYLALGY